MTDKKRKIILVALELFANEGFKSVTTSKIAKRAGVSEGLIFKHFASKQGLLDAILSLAAEKVLNVITPILNETNPEKVLEKTILFPFVIEKNEYHFWKLQFKLKWELEISGREKMQPLLDKLSWAFTELNFEHPDEEAEVLNHIIESISVGILKEGVKTQLPLKDFLLKKYEINIIK